MADDVDFRSDQFSFGAVLYEMVNGQVRHFQGRGRAEIMAAILRDQPRALALGKAAGAGAFLLDLRACLAKDPNQRYCIHPGLGAAISPQFGICALMHRTRHTAALQATCPYNARPSLGGNGEVANLRQASESRGCAAGHLDGARWNW